MKILLELSPLSPLKELLWIFRKEAICPSIAVPQGVLYRNFRRNKKYAPLNLLPEKHVIFLIFFHVRYRGDVGNRGSPSARL